MVETEIVHVEQSEEANNRTKKRYLELNSNKEIIIDDPRGYSVEKVSDLSRLLHEFTHFSKDKNTIWAFCEADITDALKKLKQHKKETGESISFTAFLISVIVTLIILQLRKKLN